MATRATTGRFRIGHGFDIHRLVEGRPLVVAGKTLDSAVGPEAHSDGDVVYHAVTDAILGALAGEDIGQLFPDDDPKWKDADSSRFVLETARRMRDAGFQVANVDVTVILQGVKLAPHLREMEQSLADLLDCGFSQVNLKGRTHEGLDAAGRGEAIVCHAVVLLEA